MIVETAGATELAVLQHAHARIGKTTDLALLCVVCGDLHYGSSCDLIRAEHPELNAYNRLCLGAVRKIRHIC